MKRTNSKAFTKWLPAMFPTPLQLLEEVHIAQGEYLEENIV
jgi:hypothetical protein